MPQGWGLGAVGSALSASTMRVDPERIPVLSARLRELRDRVSEFIVQDGDALITARPPGTDPCSARMVDRVNANGEEALAALTEYRNHLDSLLRALAAVAANYRSTDATNAEGLAGVER